MSKKNKNKNRYNKLNNQPDNRPSIQAVVQTPPAIIEVTDDTKLEIEITHEEISAVEVPEGVIQEITNEIVEEEKSDNLAGYWEKVKEVRRKYDFLVKKAEEEENKVVSIRNELELRRTAIDKEKADFDILSKSLSQREQEITEREFLIANNEYTSIIRRLVDSLKESQSKVFTETENLMAELAEFHKTNLKEFSDYYDKKAEIEKKENELKREKKILESNKAIFAEDIRDEYDLKYTRELQSKTMELERIKRKVEKLEVENIELKNMRSDLLNTFDSVDPSEILEKYSFLKEELSSVKSTLNERPENYELESKQDKIEELQSKLTEYQEKLKEGEWLELKQKFNSMETYIIEINAYKSQIESAKLRESSLKKTIDDLSATVDQLKGESAKKSLAFEYAKKFDDQIKNYGTNHLANAKDHPGSLTELVTYLQNIMASQENPFYYSEETVRIFLSGLHMSSITILQGISGTGKTSLPREFSKGLLNHESYSGIDSLYQNQEAYRICAIQSGWRDNMDLMGYFNSFENKYKETDFFKALYLANTPKYKDTLFFIILDEMNLSRPEHYFADFLSILEQAPSERFISLANTPEEAMPKLIKGGKLRIPENIRFIGTANHDETTLEFAAKTYDRSNILEMPKSHPKPNDIKRIPKKFNITYSWLSEKFSEADQKNIGSWKKFDGFIKTDELTTLLEEKGIGIGNRFENQAKRFISVFVESGTKSKRDVAVAADHLIASRLFRTLKNRYDLDKNNILKFKDDYCKIFSETFEQQPNFAIELLKLEIEKK